MTNDVRTVPYPGGKTSLAPWIVDKLPEHTCYVEPFAGSAAVLARKPRSTVEVLNDADDMLTRTYKVIRDDLGELEDRLASIPYSRGVHNEWKTHLTTREWPDDDVEAAARWFFLRYSQHSAKLVDQSGFKTSKVTNPASAFANAVDALPALADRLDGVIIENGDWQTVAERYDGPESLQYFDPPYADGKGDELYTHSGEFSHSRLVNWLEDSESRWILSYETLPDCLDPDPYYIVERETTYRGSARDGEATKEATERLICNFNPDEAEDHNDADQASLTEICE